MTTSATLQSDVVVVGAAWVYLRTQTDRADNQPLYPELLNRRAFPVEVKGGFCCDDAIKQHVYGGC